MNTSEHLTKVFASIKVWADCCNDAEVTNGTTALPHSFSAGAEMAGFAILW